MKFTHFYIVPFTGLGLHNGFRGNHWLKNRLKVFREFVLPSLRNQGNDFYVWFCWRKEEENNELVKEFIDYIEEYVKAIHTFGGIPFYDDKYPDAIAKKRLLSTLETSLPELERYVIDPYVLLTIQPSDDCYVGDTAQRLKETFSKFLPKTNKAVGYRKGYIMNYTNKEIAEYMSEGWKTDEISTYHTDTIPPFFTILFSKEEFLDPQKHFAHIGPYKSHEYIGDHLEYTELSGRGFAVGCHGENISTTYNNRYKGRLLKDKEAEDVLTRLGILYSRPVKMTLSLRVKLRQLVNVLPFRNMLKLIYYKLPVKLRIF